jgi:mannan endo-1,6-alpha-mannosidase
MPAHLTFTDSVKSWSKDLASSIINSYYKTRPASLDGLFYDFPVNQNTSAQTGWAESASIWDALIGYSHMTGDLQYNDIIAEALYAQMGPKQDFVLGGTDKLPNDEQSQWALTALSAAEYGFPKPIPGKPTFFNLARNVFSSQVSRWDPKTCNGGLPVFVGDKSGKFTSKNAHSASSFFLLGARLNKLTGEKVFAQWAERQFEWAQQSGLIGKKFEVYDIMHSGCDIDMEVSTNINLGRWMEGCAVMLSNVSSPPSPHRNILRPVDLFFLPSFLLTA